LADIHMFPLLLAASVSIHQTLVLACACANLLRGKLNLPH